MKEDIKNGALGLKSYSRLSLKIKDQKGRRVTINDPRLATIWETAVELKVPVLIHSGKNKRQWSADKDLPNWQTIMNMQHDLFKKNPKTIFINAHLDWHNQQLNKLSVILDKSPNVYVDFAGVLDLTPNNKQASK